MLRGSICLQHRSPAVQSVRGLLDKFLMPIVDIEFPPHVLLVITGVYIVYTKYGTHKTRTPGYLGDCISYDGAKYLWVFSKELASCDSSGADNFEALHSGKICASLHHDIKILNPHRCCSGCCCCCCYCCCYYYYYYCTVIVVIPASPLRT